MSSRIILMFIFSLFIVNVFCQKRSELIKLKEKNIKEIKLTESLLKETKEKKLLNINNLNVIENNIKKHFENIRYMNSEVEFIDKDIFEKIQLISSLENDLIKMKDKYAGIIRQAYKRRYKENFIMFLIASESFNQAYKRIKFLQQYTEYTEKQKNIINALIKITYKEIDNLKKLKVEKDIIIAEKDREKITLLKKKTEYDSLIERLKKDEENLIKEIKIKKIEAVKIKNEMERIISKETKKRGNNIFDKLTPEEKLISGNFDKNFGKLPWPTEKGVLSEKFGEQNHPALKNIKIKNDGINILTPKDSEVRSVFEGIVTRVFSFPGSNYGIIIRHGNFFTLYNNIVNVYVKEGQKVKTKQPIGKIFYDSDKGDAILHFQIWKEKEKVNPEEWLSD